MAVGVGVALPDGDCVPEAVAVSDADAFCVAVLLQLALVDERVRVGCVTDAVADGVGVAVSDKDAAVVA